MNFKGLKYFSYLGSKKQLFRDVFPFIVNLKFKKYYELFCGSGSFYFNLFYNYPNKIEIVYLTDVNFVVLSLIISIQHFPEDFLEYLKKNIEIYHKNAHNHEANVEYFKNVKLKEINDNIELFNRFENQMENLSSEEILKVVELCSNYYILSYIAYNGSLIFTKEFKISMMTIRNYQKHFLNFKEIEKSVLEFHNALKNACVLNKSYEWCLESVGKDSFVYLDPPYLLNPDKKNAHYVFNFGLEEHKKLSKFLYELDSKGVKFILSNEIKGERKEEIIKELYGDWNVVKLKKFRNLAKDSENKNYSEELLVLNFENGLF